MSELTLVPPARLGALLSRARLDQNASLEEVALRSAGSWSPFDLQEIERGNRPLTDDLVATLGTIYGVSTSRIVPIRTELHLDLHERNLGIGSTTVTINSAEVDDVLERYLALLYLLRNVKPGSSLTLRDADMDVLSETLQMELVRVEQRLGELMLGGAVPTRSKLFSRRLVVPAAGLLVAVTALGSLVLVGQNSPTPTLANTLGAAAFVTPGAELSPDASSLGTSSTPAITTAADDATSSDDAVSAGATAVDSQKESQSETEAQIDGALGLNSASEAEMDRVDNVSEVLGESSAELIPPARIEGDLAGAATALAEQPTAEPTPAPTAIPTTAPTAIPTAAPTAIPTAAPAPPVIATPIPATPIPATPIPATPIPATPIPATPIPATPIPATAIPATPVPQPVATTHSQIGADAEALIAYNWKAVLPGWTVNYQGERAGYRGLTNTSSNTIDIYIKSNDNAWSIAGILAHEIAHAIDVEYMTSAQREQWLTARGMPLQWWPGSGAPDFSVGAGDFAEAIAAYWVASPSDSKYGAFTHEQLQLAASFLP